MKSIPLSDDFVDEIVTEQMKWVHLDAEDVKTREAALVVLRYYMLEADFLKWLKDRE